MKLIIEERQGIPRVLYKDGGRQIIIEEMSKAINSALGQIKGILQPQLPVGATGKLQQGLTIDPAKATYKGNRISGRMYTRGVARKYAGVVELGRGSPRKRPPPGSLVRWAMVKKGLSKKEAQRADFLIRRKIGREGIRPKLTWSSNMLRFKSIANRELTRGLKNVISRIARSPKTKRGR